MLTRRLRLTALSGGLLVALGSTAGCGGGHDGDGPGWPGRGGVHQPKSRSGEPLDEHHARRALLDPEDLGYGWSVDAADDDGDDDSPEGGEDDDSSGKEECDRYLAQQDEPSTVAEATRGFTEDDTQESVESEVESYRGDGARRTIKVLSEMPAACDGASMDFGDGSTPVAMEQLTVPRLGDGTSGMRWQLTLDGVRINVSVLCVREGRNLATLTFAGQSRPDTDLVQSLFQKASERLHDAIGEAAG